MLTKNELLELSKVHDAFCVSIFIPTKRAGQDTLTGKDALHLKNQLKDVKEKLVRKGMTAVEIDAFLKPVNALLLDTTFWRNQSDGLAIFLSQDFFKAYTVPVYFEEFNYLSGDFYLKPLMPLFNGDDVFYILALAKSYVKLYEGTKHSITEIKIDDLVPARLEDVVGYDYEQKNLQVRTQQKGIQKEGIFHGHGEGDAKEKDEIKKYFRAIDKGIMTILNEDQQPPMVLACVDRNYSTYKSINSYRNLYPKYISTNPTRIGPFILHEKAWTILEDYFGDKRKEKLERIAQFLGTGKASTEIDEIVPAALEGKIDTLFIENRADIFGTYDPETRKLKIEDDKTDPNVSLLNLAATNVVEKGGSVYILEKDEIPEGFKEMNALYRF